MAGSDVFLAALLDPACTLRRTMPQSRLVRAPLRRTNWRRLAEHHVCFILRMETSLALSDGSHHLAPGALLWLPPGVPHRLAACPARTLYRLRFRLERDEVPVPLPTGPWLRAEAWSLLPLVELAHHDWLVVGPEADLRLRCLLAVLLSHLVSGTQVPAIRRPGGLSAAQRDAVEQRIAGWSTLGFPDPATLAAAAGLGPDWFGRAFTRTYGMPPRRWLADRRLDFASNLLVASARTVGDIARRLGFAQTAQFNRQFKARFGQSPAEWRRTRMS